jgi:hypothetical protein
MPSEVSESPPRALPRWSLTLVAGLHATIFAWAGAKLPWSEWSTFAIVCFALALAHLATAVAAAGRFPVLAAIWRVASVFSLLTLAAFSWALLRSAAYLAGLYGELGEGIGAGLLAVVAVLALLTLPLAAWGLAATWRARDRKRMSAAAAVVLVAGSVGALHEASQARATPLPIPTDERGRPSAAEFEQTLNDARAELLPNWDQLPAIPTSKPAKGRAQRPPSLHTREPVACVPDPASAEASAIVTFFTAHEDHPDAQVVSRCVRALPDELARAIVELIRDEALRGPVEIDVLTGLAPLRSRGWVLDMFALRPGLDGVCDADACLMPWQLVADNHFIVNEPLAWVPDLRFGVSAVRLREALGFEVPAEVLRWDREQRNPRRLARLEEQGKATPAPDDADSWLALEGLARLETNSYVFDGNGRLIPLIRGRERDVVLDRERLEQARDNAELHIARAQHSDGLFRYLLDPHTGKQKTAGWNLPRQAGTTLVVCELGRDEQRTREVAARSLELMAKHAHASGELLALTRSRKGIAGLGSTALPAIAFFSCLDHVGPEHDHALAGMTRFLLAMQRDDGSFYPDFDLEAGRAIDGPEPMYAGGQAIFALSLAEKLALTEPERAAAAGLPDAARLHEAVERSMNFYTGPYWNTFVRDFFWLEENWHCLAARASLEHHRNDAYEQFCMDYMTYKSRVVLDERSKVAPEFWGGYSLGNILVPVNTPAAGFGEGLAAAMSIKQARGEDLEADRALMRRVLEFLIRQQWHENNCFACTPNRTVIGGFSESVGAPEIRIDFTQHAWAALGHGGAWIAE